MTIRKKKTGRGPDRIPPFTHVVPLGLSCRVTRQVRVCFGSWKVYPFDWWLTPLDGLTRYLAEPDVGRLYDPGSLAEVITRGEVSSICSTVFGFRLFHDFPRRPGANKLAAVAPGWQDHIAPAAARHEERLRRLLRLDRPGNRILFVRHRLVRQLGVPDGEDSSTALAALWDVLRSRWPQAEVRLLLVNFGPPCPLPAGVMRLDFEELPGPAGQAWSGDEGQWRRGFASLGLAVRPRIVMRLLRPLGSPG